MSPGIRRGSSIRRQHLLADGDDAGPDGQCVIRLVVARRTGADLGGGFVERQLQHRRRLQLLRRHLAQHVPAAGPQALGEGLEARFLLGGIRHLVRGAEHHHRAVVAGMVVGRARHDEAVDDRHGEADLRLRRRPPACGWRRSRASRRGRPRATAAWASRRARRRRRSRHCRSAWRRGCRAPSRHHTRRACSSASRGSVRWGHPCPSLHCAFAMPAIWSGGKDQVQRL